MQMQERAPSSNPSPSPIPIPDETNLHRPLAPHRRRVLPTYLR